MNFQTKTPSRQWMLWLAAALASAVAYAIASYLLYGTVDVCVLLPRQQRIALPLLALFSLFAWETRWDGTERKIERAESDESDGKGEETGEEKESPPPPDEAAASAAETVGNVVTADAGAEEREDVVSPERTFVFVEEERADPEEKAENAAEESPPQSGEELYAAARSIPHQLIPDIENDGGYLNLLGKSALTGYAPAMAKLGEYAMRRGAWVEAYYWMAMARRNGMRGLSAVMREIRVNWACEGFPDQMKNVSRLFPEEAGSLGRALLHLDSGHEAAQAKRFLKEHFPEFLPGRPE